MKLGVIGFGNMGSAIAKGFVNKNAMDIKDIGIFDTYLKSREKAKEIVQKDIEKDNNNKDKYSIKEGKTTLEYITKYQGNIAYKSYKIEVMYNSDKTPAREYYIDVNNGNIVNMSYYK